MSKNKKTKTLKRITSGIFFIKMPFLGGQVFYECLFSTIKLWTTTPILWPMLTGGRCSEIALCHKNWNWDSILVRYLPSTLVIWKCLTVITTRINNTKFSFKWNFGSLSHWQILLGQWKVIRCPLVLVQFIYFETTEYR